MDNNWSIGVLEWFEETVKVAYKLAAPGGSKKILFENVNFKTPKSSVVHFWCLISKGSEHTREAARSNVGGWKTLCLGFFSAGQKCEENNHQTLNWATDLDGLG